MIISLPASKSIAARALVARWLSNGYTNLAYLPKCDDCDVMQEGLAAFDRSRNGGGNMAVDLHANGTAMRLLTAVAACTPGVEVTLTGVERLCHRPMAPLVETLRAAGADIEYVGADGFAPLHIRGRILKGGRLTLDPSVSSQFVTALMLVAPLFSEGMDLRFSAAPVSYPYMEMTGRMMTGFGVDCSWSETGVQVTPGPYRLPLRYDLEPDMSSATFFYEGMALGLDCEIAGAGGNMLQGDAAAGELLAEAISAGSICADMSGMPDAVPALAVALALRNVPFRFEGVAHLRIKECDRIMAITSEMRKLGYQLDDTEAGVLSWDGNRCGGQSAPVISTYGDHRIAMAFAMAALSVGRIYIESPDVVAKSFGDFWNTLRMCGFNCRVEGDVMEVTWKKLNIEN